MKRGISSSLPRPAILKATPLPVAFRCTSWSQVALSLHADTEGSSPQRGCVSQSAPGGGAVLPDAGGGVVAPWGVLLADSGGGVVVVVVVVVAWGALLAGSEGAGVVASSQESVVSVSVSVSSIPVESAGVVSCREGELLAPVVDGAVTVLLDTDPTEMPQDASAAMRFSDVAAVNTDEALSAGTVTVVSTRSSEARSRRRVNCSTIDTMATLKGATETATATPFTYASREEAVNSAIDMARFAVKVTTDVQSEHASQGPPSFPVNPAEQ